MEEGRGGQLRESIRAFRRSFANPDLRNLQIAWAGSVLGEWSYGIAISVFAYDVGGAGLVGVATVARSLPAALAAPFLGALADRGPRRRVLLASDGIRALTLTAAGVCVAVHAPAAIVIALAGVAAVAATVFFPARAALLPSLARTPEELTSANLASSTIDGVFSFAGPAVAGLILAATTPAVPILATAATLLWSMLFVARIREVRAPEPPAPVEMASERRILDEALEGFRTLARQRDLRLIVALAAAQVLVWGALTVLVVATALQLLHSGKAGVGFLNSAMGIGGLAGAAVTLGLIGRRRLSGAFGVGLVLYGAPLALIGIWANEGVALALFLVVGVANTLVDVTVTTLLQRAVPDEVLARVFAVMESLIVGANAVGGALAAILVSAAGIRTALVAIGLFLPVVTLLAWRRLTAIDAAAPAPGPELELLRPIPIFAPLGPAALEELASHLRAVRVEAGREVFRQGEPGDRFYVIADGRADILVDGALVRTEGPGEFFGEIALLRGDARTATVRARDPLRLYSLAGDEFVAAVTGHSATAEAAGAVVAARLERARPAGARL